MKRFIILLLPLIALMLTACDGGTTPGGTTPGGTTPGGAGGDTGTTTTDQQAARVVEAYLRAKVDGDSDGVRANLCPAMEADFEREAFSFSGVEADLEDMLCAVDAGGQTVTCAGRIVALYGADTRFFELSTYNVVRDDGVWKWCGETAADMNAVPTPTPEGA